MRKPVSLQEILKNAIENTLGHTDIFWEMDIPTDLLPLYGDENQLQQVFANLVRNAVEAVWDRYENGDSGKITLQARNRQLEDDRYQQLKPGKYVSITIEDNGAGIQREHLGKVFDPYFSTKDLGPQKGMGLGLAICYSIVTKHGGAIKIESEYGKGTVVEIYLPAFSEEAGVSAKGKEEVAAGREKSRIMLMDDDQSILDMTGRMLTKMGYNVETFTEGGKALRAYKKAKEEQHPFDAVLLDIVIKKGMGGKETLKKLLEFDPDARGMAISGYMDDSDVVDLKKEGFLEVLPKPFRRKELEQALTKILPE
jgi:CheY-like chemotaxis protein